MVLAWEGQADQSDEGAYFRRFSGDGAPLHGDTLQRVQGSNVALASFNEGTSFLFGAQVGLSNQQDEYVVFASNGAINDFNRAPDGEDITVGEFEDTPYIFTLMDFEDDFNDLENDPFAGIRITSLPTDGILRFGTSAASIGDFVGSSQLTAGQLVFVPDTNFDGTTSFEYIVNDGNRDSFFTNTATLTFEAVNDAPEFSLNNALEVEQGSANNVIGPGILEVTDVDDDDSGLTLEITGGPTFGTVFNGGVEVQPGDRIPYADFVAGLVTYSHNGNNAGNDSLDFRLRDGGENLPLDTVIENTFRINVSPSQGPSANPDAFAISENTVLSGVSTNLLTNDSLNSNSFSINTMPVDEPTHGSLTINQDGTFVYEPDQDFVGVDSFVYEVSNGGLTSQATVTITVGTPNNAPVANADTFEIEEDSVLSGAATFLLGNDNDVDSDPFSINTEPVSGPSNGRLTINEDGTFIYTPNGDFNGTDEFFYEINDDEGLSDIARVEIVVRPIDDLPIGIDVFERFVVGGGVDLFTLLTRDDIDVDSQIDGVEIISQPENGDVFVDANGELVFVPDDVDFEGQVVFRYAPTSLGQVGQAADATLNVVRTGALVPSTDVEDEEGNNSSDSELDPLMDLTVGTNDDGNDSTGSSEDSEVGNVDVFQDIGRNLRRASDLNSSGLDFAEFEFDSDRDLFTTYAYSSDIDIDESSYERILDGKTNSSSEEVLFFQGFFDELDSAKYQFIVDFDFTFPSIAAAGTSFLTVGYLAWMLRGGVLLTTFMSSIPAWRMLDPLAVLESAGRSGDDDDGQSIGELVDS